MNATEWLLTGLIAAAVVLALVRIVRDKKRGKGCGCGCEGCSKPCCRATIKQKPADRK